MKVLYRPQRGGLAEAMEELREFSSVEDMLAFLVDEHSINGKIAFDKDEIYISYYCYDERINWVTYIVCVGRYFDEDNMEKYHCPQAIGYCTFKD